MDHSAGHSAGLQFLGRLFYVDTNNSQARDTNAGTSLTAPWKTIGKAASTMVAGDTALVRKGTYSETITPQNSGTAQQYISDQNYGGDTVVVTGGISVTKNYIEIKGFACDSCGIDESGAYDLVQEDYVHDRINGDGISLGGSHNICRYNRVANCGAGWGDQTYVGGTHNIFEFNDVSDPGKQGEDLMKFGGAHDTICNNYFHDLTETGRHDDVFQCGGDSADDFLFRNNLILHIGGQFGMLSTWTGLPLKNITFEGNACWKDGTLPIGFNVLGVVGLSFINNTFDCGSPILLRTDGTTASTGAVIKNNIFYNGFFSYDSVSTPATADYNLIYPDPTGQWGAPPKHAHDIWGSDPKFVGAADYNYHLQAGSPAIDAATSDGAPTTDMDGTARYDDPATPNKGGGTYTYYDIGADQYTSVGMRNADFGMRVNTTETIFPAR